MAECRVYRVERIIAATIDLIHESGFHSVSTKEIARRLHLSESTIFKHFPKKNDLLSAVLNQLSLYDMAIYQTVRPMDPKTAIMQYVDTYMTYYENYPAMISLLRAYELLHGMGELADKARQIHETKIGHMRDLIERAQSSGDIDKKYGSLWLADLFISAFDSSCILWSLRRINRPLREDTTQTFRMLLDAFKSH